MTGALINPFYDARQMASKWRSFSGQGVTAGTLFHLARQHGWRRSRRRSYQPYEEALPQKGGLPRTQQQPKEELSL